MKTTVLIKRNATPPQFADKKNHITGDFAYRMYNPKTGEISTPISAGQRIIGGYYNCLEINGLLYFIMYSFFWSQSQLEDERAKIEALFNQ